MTVSFYIIGLSALAIFGYGCYVEIRKYKRGKAFPTLPEMGRRVKKMVSDVLAHRTLKRRDVKAGKAHMMIFYGFAICVIATGLITLQEDITKPLTGITFWYGSFYLWFSLTVDIAGVALISGLLYMMYRRKWMALPKLDYKRPDRSPEDPDYNRMKYTREDWAFLWSLIIIAITGFFLEAIRLVWLQGDPTVYNYRWWSPVGNVIAEVIKGLGMGPEGAATTRMFLWWFHGLIALTFIAVIPRTKIKHVLTALGSLSVRSDLPMQRLPEVDMDQDKIGYSKLTDFNFKNLLHLDACTKCGRCHEACPANATGYPLSPRDFVLTLRELAEEKLEGKTMPADEELRALGDGVNQVRSETLWACRTCAACVEICPVGIEHVPMIVEMRRALIEEGDFDPMLQTSLQALHKSGNSFGDNKRKRPNWTKKLDFNIKNATKEPVDVLWFVGDYASFDPRSQKVSQDFARILNAAGVDFGILYEKEMSAGNDVRRVGEEGLYQHLVENNIATLEACEFNRIVTTDPHSFNTLKNEYPEFGGKFEVEHASTMIKRLLDEGTIKLDKEIAATATYHDPCHLGRYNKGYDAPREALKKMGIEVIEMTRSRDNSFCCGAGGGRIWHADPIELEKPSENRAKEAMALEGVDTLVVNCPKCMTMMEDGCKSTGADQKLVVKELIELVAERMTLEAPEEPAEEAAPAAVAAPAAEAPAAEAPAAEAPAAEAPAAEAPAAEAPAAEEEKKEGGDA
ncbi:MAG: heterodisulfide reductase-related iron-sulfur binding cluster [Pseudomonadales bacterium]